MNTLASFQRVLDLQQSGNGPAAIAAAIGHAAQQSDSPRAVREALGFLVSQSAFSAFPEMVDRMLPHLPAFADDAATLLQFGYAAWVSNEPEAAEPAFRRALMMEPASEPAYRMLAQLYLTSQRWQEAFFVAHAARDILPNKHALSDMLPLIDLLARGVQQVTFTLDGENYAFRLTCHNGQAMEADAMHSQGALTEYEELKFLSSWLPPVRKVVECGCLVGNHTVYFLKKLRPQSIEVYDASPWSLNEMAHNVSLNASEDLDTEINCHHRAVAAQGGQEIELLGETVQTTSLAEAIDEGTDFVKIDIDGMEAEILDSLLQGLQRSQAYLMIEVQQDCVALYKRRLSAAGYRLDNQVTRSVDCNLFFRPI